MSTTGPLSSYSNSVDSKYGGDNYFSNPFTGLSNKWMPSSMSELFDLCEWMYRFTPTYRGAIDRMAKLFFTKYIYETSEDVKGIDVIKEFLEETGVFSEDMLNAAIDYLTYGNSYMYLHLPFQRMMRCTGCGKSFKVELIDDLNYETEKGFTGECPKGCGNVSFEHRDQVNKDVSKIRLIRVPPAEIQMIHNKSTGSTTYFWDMSQRDRDKYRKGKGTTLIQHTPVEILQAVFEDKKIQFEDGDLLHMKQPTLAGMNIEYGMPFTLSCFPLVFYISILRKANEAISMDYIVPLRIIYPQTSSSSEESRRYSSGKFVSAIQQIIKSHRRDPAGYYVAPTSVGYQVIGGEKKALMVSNDIKMSSEELLNSMGVFAEFFYGTMNMQATPMALRTMENTFGLTKFYNTILKWALRKVTRYINIPHIKVDMARLDWADNIEKRQTIMALAQQQILSEIDLLEALGFNYEDVQRRKINQQKIQTKLQDEANEATRMQEEMAMSAGQGGDGGGMGTGSSSDIMAQAQEIAMQLDSLPDDMRRSELDNLLKSHPLLHHAVEGELEKLRSDNKTQAYYNQRYGPME